MAARLLPRSIRDDATALYAFCRIADDAVDASDDPIQGLVDIRQRLNAIYAGRPAAHAVDRAMAVVIRRHDVPYALPAALIEGLAWDLTDRRYATLDELRAYAVRVAGSVGLMMTLIMGRRDTDTLTRAGELGVAMQLTNIARDIGEDARVGRCYLPTTWLDDEGVAIDALPAMSQANDRLCAITARLLAQAESHYAYALPGIAALPFRCRPGVRAAADIYGAIGDAVADRGFDSISQRAVVSSRDKWRLLLAGRTRRAPPHHAPSATEMAYLIAEIKTRDDRQPSGELRVIRWWQIRQQWIWAIELFGRLAERQRANNTLDKPRVPKSYESDGLFRK